MGKRISEYVLKFRENVHKRLSKVAKVQDRVARRFDKINRRVNEFRRNLKATIAEIPVLDRALSLLRNPFAVLGGLAVGVAFGLSSMTTQAAAFNSEFLPIQNLNLDKTNQQLMQLRSNVLSLSIQEGFNAADTAKAYYDIQSATGLYGKKVEELTRKVGRFSQGTGADMADSVNATVKAMKAYGLQVNQVDDYLASNAKTVQVGITTFNELAKVQTEYSGAAAAIGQDFNTANKVFAAFTAIAKDSNTAATMTKTAFEGLTAKSTVDGFKSIGVQMYNADGSMRSVDRVISDLVPKFKAMSDQDFNTLLNKIGGTEGLRNLLKQVKVAGDDVIKTFDAFDRSKFDVNQALKNARGDFGKLKEIVANQLNATMIMLGQNILPLVIRGLSVVNNLFTWLASNGSLLKDVLFTLGIFVGGLAAAWLVQNAAMVAAGGLMLWVKAKTTVLTAAQWLLNAALTANPIGIVIGLLAAIGAAFYLAWQRSAKFRGIILGSWEAIKGFGVLLKDYVLDRIKGIITGIAGLGKALWKFVKGDWKDAWETGKQAMLDVTGAQAKINLVNNSKRLKDDFNTGYQKGIDSFNKSQSEKRSAGSSAAVATDQPTAIAGVAPGVSSSTPLDSGGGSTRMRNVTVNIGKLIENIEIKMSGQSVDIDELVAQVEEAIVRGVRGSEQILSEG